jgi:hypothetical protein
VRLVARRRQQCASCLLVVSPALNAQYQAIIAGSVAGGVLLILIGTFAPVLCITAQLTRVVVVAVVIVRRSKSSDVAVADTAPAVDTSAPVLVEDDVPVAAPRRRCVRGESLRVIANEKQPSCIITPCASSTW